MNKFTSKPPPPGIYVPAIIFFNENDELDVESIKSHVLRLAKVRPNSELILDELIDRTLHRVA